jgi:hypothetical protein
LYKIESVFQGGAFQALDTGACTNTDGGTEEQRGGTANERQQPHDGNCGDRCYGASGPGRDRLSYRLDVAKSTCDEVTTLYVSEHGGTA